MKAIGHILWVLLVLSAVTQAADTEKSPAVLLQEALYQEETAGDLDKAIALYGQVLKQAAEVERLAARATYQLGLCHLKKGDQTAAADYFQKAVSAYPGQMSVVKKAQAQLEIIAPTEPQATLFEKLSEEVLLKLGNMYGETCSRAGLKQLYTNSHIYYVDPDYICYSGGYGYYTNPLNMPLTQKVRLSGTTNPNLLYYDISGRKMNTQIVPDENRPNFYHVYWTPSESLPPGQLFMYGWCSRDAKKLPMLPAAADDNAGNRILTMQNYYGDHAFEVFYLILPAGLYIVSASEPHTDSQTVGDFLIYAWEKEVQPDENHLVTVYLSKKHKVQNWVEDFFKHNYRDITARKTIEWGEPIIHDNGNISIRYKYEATIWDKDKKINDEIFTFDKDGKFVSVVDANPDPLKAENLVAEGWKLWQQRKLVEAEDKFSQAARSDPKNDGAYQGLGWAQLNQGKKQNAEVSFKKCVKLNPQNSAALNGLGWIAYGQDKKDEAIKWWQKAVQAQPGATAALNGLTQTYMEMKQYDKAIKYYEIWLKVDPNNQDAKDGLEKARSLLKQ